MTSNKIVFDAEYTNIISDFGVKSILEKRYEGLLEAINSNDNVEFFDNRPNGGQVGPWKLTKISNPKYVFDSMVLYETCNYESKKKRLILVYQVPSLGELSGDIGIRANSIFLAAKKEFGL